MVTVQKLTGVPRLRRNFGVIAALVSAVAIQGCVTTENLYNQQSDAPGVALPTFDVGMAYSFDNGITETVMAVDGEVLTWRTGGGVIRTRYRNFLLPFLSWQNSTQRSKTTVDAPARMLWPLKIGNSERFNTKQIVENNDGTGRREISQSWQCIVDGTEKVTVPAGTYDTYKIDCYRYYRKWWRQTKSYYYAPSVGYYVLLKDDSKYRPSRRQRLVFYGFNSMVLPISDRRARQLAIQRALNWNTPYGKGVPWQSADGKVKGLVTPIRADKNDPKCRIYTRAATAFGHTNIIQGRACQQPNGTWQERLATK